MNMKVLEEKEKMANEFYIGKIYGVDVYMYVDTDKNNIPVAKFVAEYNKKDLRWNIDYIENILPKYIEDFLRNVLFRHIEVKMRRAGSQKYVQLEIPFQEYK